MKFVNTKELKNNANHLLRLVGKRVPVVVTLRGHPCAALLPINEEQVEELVWEFSPKIRRAIERGLADVARGRVTTLGEFARTHRLG